MNKFNIGDTVYIQNMYIESYTVTSIDDGIIEISNGNSQCGGPASFVSKTVEECQCYNFEKDIKRAIRRLNRDLAECKSLSIEEKYQKAVEAFRFAADLILSRQHFNCTRPPCGLAGDDR